MTIHKTIRLIFTFYKSFLLASLLITGACGVLFAEYGMGVFKVLFWLKTTTLAITFYFINTYKAKEYYYYQNLGISRVLLWSTTLIFDFMLFVLMVVLLYKFK